MFESNKIESQLQLEPESNGAKLSNGSISSGQFTLSNNQKLSQGEGSIIESEPQ